MTEDLYHAKLDAILAELRIVSSRLAAQPPAAKKTVHEWDQPTEETMRAELQKHVAMGVPEIKRDVISCVRAAQFGVSWAGTWQEPSQTVKAWDAVRRHILEAPSEAAYRGGPFGLLHPDMAVYGLLTGLIPYEPQPFQVWSAQANRFKGVTLEDWLAHQWSSNATPSGDR